MELYRYFMQNKPRRTLRFIWCGSEERGLLGSKAYVAAHENLLSNIVLCINVDVAAPVLGIETAVITADESLTHAVDYMAKEIGFPLKTSTGIYSSDSIPFADKGIPAINFSRVSVDSCEHIHDRNDTMFPLSAEALESTGSFVEKFANRFVNAFAFPIPRIMPESLRKKIDEYLCKQQS